MSIEIKKYSFLNIKYNPRTGAKVNLAREQIIKNILINIFFLKKK